jgi:CTP synthase
MQCLVVEFARNVAGLPEAASEECAPPGQDKIFHLTSDWYNHRAGRQETRGPLSNLGGAMRLGAYPCRLLGGTLAHRAYREAEIQERHRHRFEFNSAYLDLLSRKGLKFCGLSPDKTLVEMVELPEHPWLLGCQFHPEFKSKPMKPHPLFRDFIKAALAFRQGKTAAK